MFNTNIKVYFFDADPAGIIFYASLFKFSHSAYEDLMRQLKLDRNYFFDPEFVLPIVHTESDYLKPIKVGDDLKIDVWVSRLMKSSFELSYKFHQSDYDVAATAKTVHVCVSKAGFKKVELPADLFSKLSQHLID
ncbi:MAG: thioesterase family protein [Melioribacteraceae bacterium]|nr:thioesterase family protein [Melioribacteraceae bacterium]